MPKPDPTAQSPFIIKSRVLAADGKKATLYRTNMYQNAPITKFFITSILLNCWVFIQGLGLMWLLWCILPRWLSSSIFGIYAVSYIVHRPQDTGKGRWGWLMKRPSILAIMEYFAMGVLVEDGVDFQPDRQYLIGLHPHAAHCFGSLPFSSLSEHNPLFALFPEFLNKLRLGGATVLFYLPFIREMLYTSGWVLASRKVLEKQLARGGNVGLIIGGEAESIASENLKDKVVIEGRKGFVRLALRYGAELVPTYTFYLNETFHFDPSLAAAPRHWLQRNLKVCLPVLWGLCYTPAPRPAVLLLAIGQPIPVPTRPGRDRIHAQYVSELQRLFEAYKSAAGYAPHRKLEILRAPEA
eukprot:CAMPEP_0177725196 /NCGR_PEP_ID=MMETSP0484_2-20121128/19122_1 /TAXON_ID=354590 /ORGANISM="Rhodomonas lens, Strain RHODO" /LENGTH=353 /DNA_ID=CAMNT_0019237693 /DNA_START=38 /DNA_END=1095 /DNA_ORIENTATION=+